MVTTAYLGGQPITLSVSLLDSEGTVIPALSIEYRVINQAEVELVPKTAVVGFTVGDEQVSVTVPADKNVLQGTNTLEVRVVEVYATTASGVIKLEGHYFIESEEVLVEGVNSFQPYALSLMLSSEIPNLPGWNNATKAERIVALKRARMNIGQLRFRYVFDAYQNIVDNTLGVADLTLATPAQYAAFPLQFKEALRRAQILEADYLLGGDELGQFRRDGLMSMTTGEAKQFFRPIKPIEAPVCKRAMRELTKWVLSRHRLTRT